MRSILRFLNRQQATERRPRCVVYTCLFGFSEHFNDFVYERDDNIDFICFTDDPELRSAFWKMKIANPELLDPTRAAKQIKALPHRFLSEYDWSLYIDNTVRLKRPPKQLFQDFLATTSSPFVSFSHPERNCVYEEADEVIERGLDNPDRVRAQMRFYRELGYPVQNGLGTNNFILRRHHDPILMPVMERWHQQVLCHSKRDQLSLNPVMWFVRFEPKYLDLQFSDFELFEWPVIKNDVRIPRNFDDSLYLQLNPDVKINARRHYLFYGAAEGRPHN